MTAAYALKLAGEYWRAIAKERQEPGYWLHCVSVEDCRDMVAKARALR